ncbi:MAG TPA: proton-conducting transporter membrane subunit [Thermodesulfobacteriota bacterium]|nr:proton-conducting transporter membrane subunit [Thermodesulfobacteriota bacterium]
MELIYILIIPALAGVLSLIPAGKKFAPAVTILGALAVLIFSIRASFRAASGVEVVAVENWISSDSLSALVLLLVAFVGFTAAVFSWGYIEKTVATGNERKIRRYYALYNLFLLSMLAVPILSQVALVWIAVELTTLLSVFLVSFENTPEALEAAWKYVVLTCLGAAFALLGVLILYWGMSISGRGPFTWQGLVTASPGIPPMILKTSFVFILIGFGTKAGLVPLHTWLPDAHSQAPSPVCALLSGVETTAVLYAILRLLPVLRVAPSIQVENWFIVFGLLSVGTAAFLLIQVKDYKRLFAFSTVEHMGIILVAAGLGSSAAQYGATFQMISHALSKSFCFFAAGSTLLSVGTRDITAVRGLIRTSPVAAVALMIGGLAIAGAPPFTVFLSEFSILKEGMANGHYLVTALLALFIVIAFCGILFPINRMVFGKSTAVAGRTMATTSIVAIILAAIPVISLGLYLPGPLHELLRLAAASLGR